MDSRKNVLSIDNISSYKYPASCLIPEASRPGAFFKANENETSSQWSHLGFLSPINSKTETSKWLQTIKVKWMNVSWKQRFQDLDW
jgi:hypothetical protein